MHGRRRPPPPDASDAPPADLRAWLEAALGRRVVAWTPLPSPRAAPGAAAVHRLDGPSGPLAVLKRHADLAKHRREVATHRALDAVATSRPAARAAPPLLAAAEAPSPRLLTGFVPGEPAPQPPDVPATAVLEGVGAFLAALHHAPVAGHDPLPVEAALRRRADAALRGAPDGGEAARTRGALVAAREPLAGRARHLAHRDAGPHNWRVDGAGRAAVLDFEHARADLPDVDLARLVVTFHAAPDAARTVLAAYAAAGGPAPLDAAVLLACARLDATAARAWAAGRPGSAARALRAEADAALARLRTPADVPLP